MRSLFLFPLVSGALGRRSGCTVRKVLAVRAGIRLLGSYS